MKILVTGGAGFIGSNFVCHALESGHEIINIDKLTYAGNLKNLAPYQDHPKHHFYQVDICDGLALERIFSNHRPDVVLHMAAESHVDRSIDSPDVFIQTNINGTYTLLNASLKYYKTLDNTGDFRFIHLSTDEVFGALGPTGKFNETMPYKPNSPYAASKASSDLLVRSYHKTYDFPSIIVNASNNYGPKQYPEKLIPLTLLNALSKKTLPIYGDGQQVRDWLFVGDHVNALMAIITSGHLGESYCIGADNEMCNLALVHLLCDTLDDLKPNETSYRDLIEFVKDRPGHDFRYATDSSKLKKHTGWAPTTSLKKGMQQTVEWYLNSFENQKIEHHKTKRMGLGK